MESGRGKTRRKPVSIKEANNDRFEFSVTEEIPEYKPTAEPSELGLVL